MSSHILLTSSGTTCLYDSLIIVESLLGTSFLHEVSASFSEINVCMHLCTYSETGTSSSGEEILQVSKLWQCHDFIGFLKFYFFPRMAHIIEKRNIAWIISIILPNMNKLVINH